MALRIDESTGIGKRKHCKALSEELPLKDVMDLSQNRLRRIVIKQFSGIAYLHKRFTTYSKSATSKISLLLRVSVFQPLPVRQHLCLTAFKHTPHHTNCLFPLCITWNSREISNVPSQPEDSMRFMQTKSSLPCSYNSLPFIPKQINPFYRTPSYFFKIHFNIILPYTPGSSRRMCSFTLLLHTLCTCVFSPICARCPTHPLLLK